MRDHCSRRVASHGGCLAVNGCAAGTSMFPSSGGNFAPPGFPSPAAPGACCLPLLMDRNEPGTLSISQARNKGLEEFMDLIEIPNAFSASTPRPGERSGRSIRLVRATWSSSRRRTITCCASSLRRTSLKAFLGLASVIRNGPACYSRFERGFTISKILIAAIEIMNVCKSAPVKLVLP